jgi:hypothetical protein
MREMVVRIAVDRAHRRSRRRGPVISKAGWLFLLMMFGSALLWAAIIAGAAAIAHYAHVLSAG